MENKVSGVVSAVVGGQDNQEHTRQYGGNECKAKEDPEEVTTSALAIERV
jgi:hypothetical protein